MTQDYLERICESVFEYTRGQLSTRMGWPSEPSLDEINDIANAVQLTLQTELRAYCPNPRPAQKPSRAGGTFEDFLRDKFMETYNGNDDDSVRAYERWIDGEDLDTVIKLADEYASSLVRST